jgi:catechol 2,3-dioxygenase-like lactoylglutathione lyase family enzyme
MRRDLGNGAVNAAGLNRDEREGLARFHPCCIKHERAREVMESTQRRPGCASVAPSTGRETMAKFGWDHIHLRSPDPEATAAWYERMLDAQVIRTMQQGKPRIDLKIGGNNVFLAPVAAGDGVNPPPTTPYQGLDHFGLVVSGIDAIVADLKGKGVEFTREPTTVRPGTRVAFLRAPQGVSIELLDRDPKYT